MKNNKTLMMIFRLLIIVTAVVSIVCFVNYIDSTDNLIDKSEEMATAVKCYKFTAFAYAVLLVLSLLCTEHCRKISSIFRTIELAICTVIGISGFKSSIILGRLCDIYSGNDEGLSSEQCSEALSFSMDSESLALLLSGIFLTAIIMLILALTSVHWIVKKKEEK